MDDITSTGTEIIAAFAKDLPPQPGVYRMLDAKGAYLYVGKAKSLKKRVLSYTQPERQSSRIQRMITLTCRMEFTVTHTEAEALLLEANLIKTLKPRYNILLRDDKSFPSILITHHDFPQVTKHRGAKAAKGEYFGPFASGSAVNETLDVLRKAFQLRNCTDNVFAQRTRPCLQYQIKRCTAPCVGKVGKQEYAEQVDMARRFLRGKSREIQDNFAHKMQAASTTQHYEEAALWRDRIHALTQIQARQTIHIEGLDSADVHAIWWQGGVSCVQTILFRDGGNFGNRCYFPRHEKDDTEESVLSAFIGQFYTDKPPPKIIIVSHDIEGRELIEEALAMKAAHKVSIIHPLRGDKKDLIDMALKNAQEALTHKLAADSSTQESLKRLTEVFALPAPPERIEVYDNSHISGTHALGAMIVAGLEGLQKNAYRKFNFSSPSPLAGESRGEGYKANKKSIDANNGERGKFGGDDYAMMREMLARRFKTSSLSRKAGEGWGEGDNFPDLVLIDGGQGQLTVALQVMADLGVSDIPVVAIAKGPDRNAGRERFFMQGRAPFTLEPTDPLLYFLQRLRDEAHRFAITSHRAKRSRAITANPLDEIQGIGGKRKKALLLHFGSAKAVAEAGVSDLQKVTGISKAVAEKIYGFFHEN